MKLEADQAQFDECKILLRGLTIRGNRGNVNRSKQSTRKATIRFLTILSRTFDTNVALTISKRAE